MSWRPELTASQGAPIYRRLVEALAADIEGGRLVGGARLPPQRDLAHALSISVGAVTRAYDDAARRGLVQAHVGRGTFVVDHAVRDAAAVGEIDLSTNTAPIIETAGAVSETIASLRKVASLDERLNYLPTCGLEVDRRAGAAWLKLTVGLDVDWERLICCTGAQAATAIAASAVCRSGDAVLCEAATFSGMKILARQQGYHLHGVEMDEEGAQPESLDRLAVQTGARLFYTLPTLHNPTARIAGKDRRAAVARVARARDLTIVEDDVYGVYARGLALSPLASSAPERTFFVSSLSKTLSPGLRVGFLVPPPGNMFDRSVAAIRALHHSPPGFGSAIATDWITSGRAEDMIGRVCEEVKARTTTALRMLGPRVETPSSDQTLHLWLPMSELDAERLAGRALRAGLRLSSPGPQTVVDGQGPSGIRLCIGRAANRATLERALTILAACMDTRVSDGMEQL
jgi:DNA-binding transcriptional MocR family regulator